MKKRMNERNKEEKNERNRGTEIIRRRGKWRIMGSYYLSLTILMAYIGEITLAKEKKGCRGNNIRLSFV